MSIRVQATGRITGAPGRVSTEHGTLAVFVLDPYPEPTPADRAHACEVRCRDSRLVDRVLGRGVVGARVAVSGQLTMNRAGVPVEDELCAVRVAIEADEVQFSAVEPSA